MKARAWGNGSNDVLETAEIHFQGHLSCWRVFMSVTLACERTGTRMDVKSPQAPPKSEQRSRRVAICRHFTFPCCYFSLLLMLCLYDVMGFCISLHLFCLTFLCFCLVLSSNREQPPLGRLFEQILQNEHTCVVRHVRVRGPVTYVHASS